MSIPHNIPKHPTDCDESLRSVLENILFCNKNGYKLVSYEIKTNEVVLNYEPYA
jgi:hypothetical protein